MNKDEHAVQDLQACMVEFEAEPFDDFKPTLLSLQSGLTASVQLVHDLSNALPDGRTEAENILKERVFTLKTKSLITATMHRHKRLYFSSDQICTSSTSMLKLVQMENHGFGSLGWACGRIRRDQT